MTESQPFKGLTFLFTGTLSSYTRVEAESLVKRHGGKVKTSVTSELNYIVVGADPDGKLQKALDLETITVLSEDEFIALLNGDSEDIDEGSSGDVVDNDDSESSDVDEDIASILAELNDLDEERHDDSESSDVDEDIASILAELGDLDDDSSDDEEMVEESDDESSDEFAGTDLTSFFISRFGTDEMKKEHQEQLENESSIEEQIDAMLADLKSPGMLTTTDSGDSTDSDESEQVDPGSSPLQESIGTFTSYADTIEQPSGLLLLTAFALVDITMHDNSVVDDEFYAAFCGFLGWIHAQAYEWDNAEESGFLPDDVLQEFLTQAKALSTSYSQAVEADSTSYRTFLKGIGAAGIGADLSPEERGDLGTYLLMFEHAISRLFEDQQSDVTRDVRATIEQIDCTELIGDLMPVARQGGNAFADTYKK